MLKVILGTNQSTREPHFGGSTWVRLQYMLGFERLGVEAFWVDRLRPPNPEHNLHDLAYLFRRFRQIAVDFGFEDRYCILYNEGERHVGMDEAQLRRLVGDSAALLNISGYLPPGSPLERIPRKAYIDVDPGFTQLWARDLDVGLERHDVFFTTGQNLGQPHCRAGTAGVEWHPFLPPIVLDKWPVTTDPPVRGFSTVADWWGGQDITVDGEWCGGKREEFLRLLDVPARCGQAIHLALGIRYEDHEDMAALVRCGWRLHNPYAAAGDPHSYQEFIQRSRAEFSVAKRGYVRTRSGWVSDRTACYLASGKPAVVQSTGFEHALPVGRGLFTFTGSDEAVEAIGAIERDYEGHADAARSLAQRYFDSDVVLPALLDRLGV